MRMKETMDLGLTLDEKNRRRVLLFQDSKIAEIFIEQSGAP